MAEQETVAVTISPEMASIIRDAIASGEYVSADQVLKDALIEWQVHRAGFDLTDEELGRLWDEGVASGPTVDGEESFARTRAQLESFISKRNA